MTHLQWQQALLALQQKFIDGCQAYSQINSVEIGTSAKTIIYQNDLITLYRYRSRIKRKNRWPLLMVFALVNQPTILDLQADCSLIQDLLKLGHDVYLIDWGYPQKQHKNLSLAHYILDYLQQCVSKVCEASGYKQINLLGICQGGVFALCYASLFPRQVKNLITMVTPVDFRTPDNMLTHLSQHIAVDKLVKQYANIPGWWLNQFFLSLKPFTLCGKKYLNFIANLENATLTQRFLAMEKWIFATPDQAGKAFLQFVTYCYRENRLIQGKLSLARRKVNLKKLTMPILNIAAKNDHLVPLQASLALKTVHRSADYTDYVVPGGHIGIYVSQKTRQQLAPMLTDWLQQRC